ncbi:MAG: CoA transferase, partial [Rhizobiales bacterium]|nr:CoA transferase [Hyphomicrobiales bacterium]
GVAGLIGPVQCAGVPVMPAVQMADYAAASYATIAVLAAYIQRQRSGRGRHLDIALYDSTVAFSNIVLASAISTECFADKCILRYLAGCAAVGAVAGIFVGLRLARQSTNADAPPPLGR